LRASTLSEAKARRRRRQAGATIIELSLLLFPTLAIVCGFMDIGMAIFSWTTLQNAVREGTRYAITYQVDGSGHQIQSIKDEVATWSMNLVSSTATSSSPPAGCSAGSCYIQVDFYAPPTASSPNGTLVTGNAGQNAPGNIVQVSIVNYPYRWMAPFSGTLSGGFYQAPGSTFSISVDSADVLGGAPVTGLPTP